MGRVAVFALGAICASGCGRIGFDPVTGPTADSPVHSQLVLDRYDAGEVLVEYPLMIVLDDTRADFSAMLPDRSDLRVYDATGTPLPVEIDSKGPPLVLYTRVPRIEGRTTTLTLGYGDPSVPLPSAGVWDMGFVAVFHFSYGLRDSTGKNTAIDMGTSEDSGFRGSGRRFVTAELDAILLPDGPHLSFDTLTLSAMGHVAMTAGFQAFIARELGDSTNDDFYLGLLGGSLYTVLDAPAGGTVIDVAVPPDEWHALAMTYDGTQLTNYVDGVRKMSKPASGPNTHTAAPTFIGANRDNNDATNLRTIPDGDFVDGLLDEVTIQNVARSAAWIAADNVSLGDAWITYGPIER